MSSGKDAATRDPSGLNDGPDHRAGFVDLELEEQFAGGGIPDPGGAVVTGRGEHRSVSAEGDVVDVDIVAVERAHRGARLRVADVDRSRVLRAFGHEEVPVRTPVHVAADTGDTEQEA